MATARQQIILDELADIADEEAADAIAALLTRSKDFCLKSIEMAGVPSSTVERQWTALVHFLGLLEAHDYLKSYQVEGFIKALQSEVK